LHQIGTDKLREKLPEDNHLIVPSKFSGRAFKYAGLCRALRSDTIDESVVCVYEREVHLRHEDVRIVTRIADDAVPSPLRNTSRPSAPARSFAGSFC
jgi:hypothetical protein